MKKTNTYFDFKDKTQKYFFAGLFNTALNNFDLSLDELANRTGLKCNGKELIAVAFNDTCSQTDYNNRLSYLSESLAFIELIKTKERSYIRLHLTELYNLIDNYRNYFTHLEHPGLIIKPLIFKLLDLFILESARTVIKERVKTEENKSYLSKKFKLEITSTFEAANNAINLENKNNPHSKTHKKLITQNDKINFVLNKAFHNFLINTDGVPTLKETARSINKDTGQISQNGIIQLLAIFLNKKQLEILFDNTHYLKGTLKLNHLCTRWTYSQLAYRNIKKLLKSDYSNDSLILQMLSELTKCPKHLYPNLPNNSKQEFIEDLNEYLKETEYFKDSIAQETVSNEVIRKRYEDKFPYFAIRFLDEFIDFPNLRFQINLGKFNHNTCLKKFENTAVYTERQILEKLTIFEKLTLATNKKTEYFLNNNLPDSEGWQEYPKPSYQFYNNNIGFWLGIKNGAVTDAKEKRENDKSSKFDILKKIGLECCLKKPVAYLSFNELPALLYTVLIEKKTAKEVERIFLKKIGEQTGAINKFADINNFEKKIIPHKFKEILENKESNVKWEKLKKDIEKEMLISPLDEIRIHYKTASKHPNDLSFSEKGKIATWLAHDIKRFVKAETKKDWKGYQFSEFQSLLAYYDLKKMELLNFVNFVLKINIKQDIVFEDIDFNQKTLYDFYKNYLSNRKKFLEGNLYSIDQKDEVPAKLWRKRELSIFTGFDDKLYKYKNFKTYKENLMNMPLNLPRGIFSDKQTCYNKNSQNNNELAEWFTKSNNINDFQKFYSFTRFYENCQLTLNPLKGLKEQNNNKGVPKEVYKNEKNIRNTMRQDFYIFEMVKYYFKINESLKSDLNDLKLNTLFLTKQEKENNLKVLNQQHSRSKGDKSENILNENYILSKHIMMSILEGKIQGMVALKSVGKYRFLSQDKRVKQLVTYIPDKIWSFEEINSEIDEYDKIRAFSFFKIIHEIEEKIFNKAINNKEESYLLVDGHPNFKAYIIYYFLKTQDEKDFFNKLDVKNVNINDIAISKFKLLFLIIKIRNKICHNQLISSDEFNFLLEFTPIEPDELYMSYLLKAYKKIVNISWNLV